MADEELSILLKSANPAMVVVTAAAGGERAGCLVGFHGQSSITPPRYCVWLSKANHTFRIGLRSTHFGLHFLGADDHAMAEAFGSLTGDETDKFAGRSVLPGPGGVPLLADLPNRLVGRRLCVLDDGGDHVCFTLEPVAVRGPTSPFIPLRQSQALDIAPGHGNAERPAPPTERALPGGARLRT
ncbi:flavin reductase [Frankia sp. CNm7]|uniref:Flavin reductase n=1 Tax=Frankia nepalensis TaxID=1836974 RepID=A0A937RH60_9ACTN|nr:flavin reductase family protein [Frankia nepalensis]MBL7495572.1 flavin reductase [Frankia nepalensis]MBL7508818.1 flavin reductase [Frankia nepalensis]MBL7521162.1 flavin reductase [Frankia nepalensis]MBL7630042.1 flavin reductase [Frankia nepalensis]